MTLTEAIAAWKAVNPIESINPPVSINDYEIMAADRGQMWLDQVNAQEARAARALLVQQFTSGMDTLRADLTVVQNRINGNTNLTAAELRIGLRDLLQSVIWLGDRIADGTIPVSD